MLIGHLAAFFTIIVWGITFISTKILLNAYSPQTILFIRFAIGWLALSIFHAGLPKWRGLKNELTFAGAGFFGITLYFLLENIALEYGQAANVGVIVSTTPFFTALVDWFLFDGAKPRWQFYLGFVCAMFGIGLISFNDSEISISPIGDLLALLAAIAWAFYSALVKKLSTLHLGSLQTTRRIFFYGLILMLPLLAIWPGRFASTALGEPAYWCNFLFLGLIASALCFATWTFCLARLGADKASAYIYLVPVVTVICAALVLHETITKHMIFGMALVFAGLILSELQFNKQANQPGAN